MKTTQPVSAAAVEPVNVLAKLLREVAAYVPKTAMYDEACTVHQIVAVALKAYEKPSATPEAVRPAVPPRQRFIMPEAASTAASAGEAPVAWLVEDDRAIGLADSAYPGAFPVYRARPAAPIQPLGAPAWPGWPNSPPPEGWTERNFGDAASIVESFTTTAPVIAPGELSAARDKLVSDLISLACDPTQTGHDAAILLGRAASWIEERTALSPPPPSTGSDGQDAKRYRYAQEHLRVGEISFDFCGDTGRDLTVFTDWDDAAIDAAMAQLTARAGEVAK